MGLACYRLIPSPTEPLLRAWHAQAEDYQDHDMGMGHAGQPGLDDDGHGLYQPMHDGGGMPSVIGKSIRR